MTRSTRSWPRRAVAVGLVGAVAGLSAPGGGRAEDDAGVRAFFLNQQPAARRAAPVAVPLAATIALPRFLPQPEGLGRPSIARAHPRRAPVDAPKVEYASLPKEPAIEKPVAPSGPRLPPLQAVLRDDTLRPGDVVMFPDGPRVFNGQTSGTASGWHKPTSFEPVGKSRLVTASARKVLAALPVASTTSGPAPVSVAARSRSAPKLASKDGALRQTALNTNAPEPASSTSVRVVYPRLGAPISFQR